MSLLFVLNATVEAGPAPQVAQSLPPELLKLNVDNFGPGIREQVKKSLAEARRNPRDANVVGRLGMILQTYEDYELAAACYTLARELTPADFRWVYLLGTTQTALGKQREAIDAFRAALRQQPENLPAQLKLAEALLASGELKESQPLYETLAARANDLAQAHYGLGRIQAAQRNSVAAIRHLQKAVALLPAYGAAHYALALALRETGEAQTASAHLALAQQHKASRPSLVDPLLAEVASLNQGATERIRLGIALAAEGHLDESIAEHERALAINSQLTQAHINLIQLHGRAGNADKATAHYRAVVALNPDLAESHYNFA